MISTPSIAIVITGPVNPRIWSVFPLFAFLIGLPVRARFYLLICKRRLRRYRLQLQLLVDNCCLLCKWTTSPVLFYLIGRVQWKSAIF
jgi:hypothetical protein